MRKMITTAVVAVLALALASPAIADRPGYAEAAKPGTKTIVEIASSSTDFDVLVAAVVRADLVSLLNGKGQFTVFAPIDAAFEATFGAPEEAIIGLINAGALDDDLGDILGYHVTKGRRTSNSVLAASSYTMLNGDRLTIGELAAAGVVPADISASNGVVHVLTGGVLLPG